MTHTHTYTTMDVLVLDRRDGDVIDGAMQAKIDAAACVIFIEPDGHLDVKMRADINTVRVEAEFARLPHIDEVSAARSQAAYKEIEKTKDEIEPTHPPAEQFARVWEDDTEGANPKYPGNHGTAKIRGM